MSFKVTYDVLIESIKNENLNPQEAQKILNEISTGLNDEQIEEVENLIYEREQKDMLIDVSFYNAIPHDAEWRDEWWQEDNGGWDE
jgi:hypothetical protein